uniref:ATP synthase CFO B subunit subunit I n=1 Tax=Timspurckia oligopyrenoides TaxID=708627 RepID=UPI001FCCCA53|nr:ATP synthase CFO B subunit subunit I [Timspurckia oligopyrenoides]UNJ17470.1 ATP synthase CFO B subunit subunit I [Timspurckia oligopyrenoides]
MKMNNNLIVLVANHSGTFAVNTDILETNIINIGILLSAIVYFGKQSLSSILGARQERVFLALQEAETKLDQASTRLAEAEKQLQQTQIVINRIKQEAEITASKIKESILAQGKIDVTRLANASKANILSAEIGIRRQIQQQITKLALQRVATNLKDQINADVQSSIMDQSISELGGKL